MTEYPHLVGRTAVITGASAGIGLHSLLALARHGVKVIGVGRDPVRCAAAEREVFNACPSARVRCLVADLSCQREVRRLAGDIRAVLADWESASLDILVNNAGTFSDKMVRTEDGIELVLAVNHLAPFLLTHELLPQLISAPFGRVLTTSSASHYHTCLDPQRINDPLLYFGLWRYKVSKLANVLFTYELNRRLAAARVRAFAVDPGLVNTAIGQKGTGALSSLVWRLRRRSGRPPEVPARTVLFLSGEESLQDSLDFYWRDCRPKTPSRLAQQEGLARRLWEVSEELCGLRRGE